MQPQKVSHGIRYPDRTMYGYKGTLFFSALHSESSLEDEYDEPGCREIECVRRAIAGMQLSAELRLCRRAMDRR